MPKPDKKELEQYRAIEDSLKHAISEFPKVNAAWERVLMGRKEKERKESDMQRAAGDSGIEPHYQTGTYYYGDRSSRGSNVKVHVRLDNSSESLTAVAAVIKSIADANPDAINCFKFAMTDKICSGQVKLASSLEGFW